jgi:hypothetical protein
MRIRVLAEETIYKEYFVEVPEEILNLDRRRIYMKKNIHNWIDENETEFNYQDYDSTTLWYTWEEVQENA